MAGRAQTTFEDLENFKEYIQETVKEYGRKKYGMDAWSNIIAPAIDDMLEDIEASIEDIAAESLVEEELEYGVIEGE
jgi:hypothetical protein